MLLHDGWLPLGWQHGSSHYKFFQNPASEDIIFFTLTKLGNVSTFRMTQDTHFPETVTSSHFAAVVAPDLISLTSFDW